MTALTKTSALKLYEEVLTDCRTINALYDTADEKALPLFETVARKIYKLCQDPQVLFEATGYENYHQLLGDGEIAPALAPILVRMKLASSTNRRNLWRLLRLDGDLPEAELLKQERLPIQSRILRVMEELNQQELPRNEKVAKVKEIADAMFEPTEPSNEQDYVITIVDDKIYRDGIQIAAFVTDDKVLRARLVSMLAHLPGEWGVEEADDIAFHRPGGSREVVASYVDEDAEVRDFVRARLKGRR